jgi:DNA-binding MarR family transcriptional regulator
MEHISFKEINTDFYTRVKHLIDGYSEGARNSIAFHGGRGCGKTSILKEIPGMNSKLEYIKIDAASVYSIDNFFYRLAEEIDCYPIKTVEWMDYANALFSYMETKESRYVFLIDNFEKLNYIRSNLIPYLRSKYMTMNNIIYIISLPTINIKDFTYSHPFYAQFLFRKMEHLDKNGTTRFMELKFGIKDKKLYDKVFSVSEGNLLITNLLCEILKLNNNTMNSYTEKVFKTVIGSIYEHTTQRRAILESLVAEPKSLQMIIKELKLKSGTVNSHLKRLVQDDYIYKSGTSKYKIRNYIKISLVPHFTSTFV